jgi:hypothetical protein
MMAYRGGKSQRRFAVPRKADQNHLRALHRAIERHPGKKPGFFARLLNWRREQVSRRLTTLNDQGVLFSEDDRGGLWFFKRSE